MLGAEPVSSAWTVSALHYWVSSPAPYIKRLLVFYFTEFNSFYYFPLHVAIWFCSILLNWHFGSIYFPFFLVFMFTFLLSHHTCSGIFILSYFFVKLLHFYVLIFYFLWHVHVLFSTFSLLGNVFLFSF